MARDIKTTNVDPMQGSVSGYSASGVTDPTFRPDYDPSTAIFKTIGSILEPIKQDMDEDAFLRGAADDASTAKAMGDVTDVMGQKIEEESMFTRRAYRNGVNFSQYQEKSLEAQTRLGELARKMADDPNSTMEQFNRESKKELAILNKHINDTGMYGEGGDKARTNVLNTVEVAQTMFAEAKSAAAINRAQKTSNQAAGLTLANLNNVSATNVELYSRTFLEGVNGLMVANSADPSLDTYDKQMTATGVQVESMVAIQLEQVKANVSDPDSALRHDTIAASIGAQLQDPRSPLFNLPMESKRRLQEQIASSRDAIMAQRNDNFAGKIQAFNYSYDQTKVYDFNTANKMEEEVETFFNMRWIKEKDRNSLLQSLRTTRAEASSKMGEAEFYMTANAYALAEAGKEPSAQAKSIMAQATAMFKGRPPEDLISFLMAKHDQTKNGQLLTDTSKLMYSMAAPILGISEKDLLDPKFNENRGLETSSKAFFGMQKTFQELYNKGGDIVSMAHGFDEKDRDVLLEVLLDPSVRDTKDIPKKMAETRREIANFGNSSAWLKITPDQTESYVLGKGIFGVELFGGNADGSDLLHTADDAATEQQAIGLNNHLDANARRRWIQTDGTSAPTGKEQGMAYGLTHGLLVQTYLGTKPVTPEFKQALTGGVGRDMEQDAINATYSSIVKEYIGLVGSVNGDSIHPANVQFSIIGEGPSAIMMVQALDKNGMPGADPKAYTLDRVKQMGNGVMDAVKASNAGKAPTPIQTGTATIPSTQQNGMPVGQNLKTFQDKVIGNNEVWVAATSEILFGEGFVKSWTSTPRADGTAHNFKVIGPGIEQETANWLMGKSWTDEMADDLAKGDMEAYEVKQHQFAQAFFAKNDIASVFEQAGLPDVKYAGANTAPYVTLMDVMWYRPADAHQVAKAMTMARAGNVAGAMGIVDNLKTTKTDKNGPRIQRWRKAISNLAGQQVAAR